MESPLLENLYESILHNTPNNPTQIIGKYIAKAHGGLASSLTSLQQVEEQLKRMPNSEVLEQAIVQYMSDIKSVQDNIHSHFAQYFNR